MNNFIGGMITLLLIVGGLFYVYEYTDILSSSVTATTTPSTNTPGVVVAARDPGAPLVITNTAVAPSDDTAVVLGTVTPNGDFTNYWYEYGLSADLGGNTAKHTIGSGFTAIPATGYITGLSKNTTYHYRLTAENQYGTVSGSTYTFVTTEGTPAPAGGIPTAKTLEASGILENEATLKGEITHNNIPAQYWFEYGKTANLGSITALSGAGDGSAKAQVSVGLADLDSATTYYFRLNAQNKFGTVNGAILNFKTDGPTAASSPSVSTLSPIDIGTTSARVRGTVTPNRAETKYWFEYSTDGALGSATLKTTTQTPVGASSKQEPAEVTVSGLLPKTTYYVRLVAQNSFDTVRGNRESFKTK